jgi:hypothetical protein
MRPREDHVRRVALGVVNGPKLPSLAWPSMTTPSATSRGSDARLSVAIGSVIVGMTGWLDVHRISSCAWSGTGETMPDGSSARYAPAELEVTNSLQLRAAGVEGRRGTETKSRGRGGLAENVFDT